MIKKKYQESGEVYYIVFKQGISFISKILKKNYSHIYVVTHDKYNWVVIDPLRLKLAINIPYLPLSLDIPRQMPGEHDTVIRVEFWQRDYVHKFGVFGLLNCVTVAKYIIGLPIKGITPYRFYKNLLNLCARDRDKYAVKSIRRIK